MPTLVDAWARKCTTLGRVNNPISICVNWFRTDENGKFVWPGYGENMRVLSWMLERVEGKGGGVEHLFGVTPRFSDLNWAGLDFSSASYEKITSIDVAAWRAELAIAYRVVQQARLSPARGVIAGKGAAGAASGCVSARP